MTKITGLTPQRLDDLLGKWGHHAAMGNQARGLGIKPPLYGERVGAGAYQDYTPDIDPDVTTVDTAIRGLAQSVKDPLILHYVDPRPVKSKTKKQSHAAYYARLTMAKDALFEALSMETVE